MAYDYNQIKKQYEWLNDQQKEQFAEMNKNDTTWNYQKFMDQYNKEKSQTPTSNESNFTNQNDTNWQNSNIKPFPELEKEKPVPDNQIPNQNNQTYNYDPNEKLDTSMFWASDGKVKVQEWTAQQTWMPDYQLDSDARTREITDNLNAYWQTNREYFQDRNTYNNMFHYNERSDQQKAVLDSYWKKKEDMNVAERYNTADGIKNWMKDAEITPDQLNYIKEYSPEAYREWQQKQIDDINLRIANLATPADPTSNAELFNSLVQKLWLEPWDPYQIYDNWYSMAERLWVFSDSEKLKSYQNQLDENHSEMESIMTRYANSAWWTVSDALAAARMQKALAPYQQREVDLQNSYTTLLNGRNSNLAIANQSAQALAMQAQEDQRIWNQRLQGLGFAMQTANYRTPEQQAQLQLQTAQIQNDMNLLQTSMQNDLNRYNAYATAKMQNQLQQELTDLSVEDEAQLKANLNNALSDYYKNYGDIIQRSQAQAVDDIIAYAKKNGISVAQAMTENFIKPLQNKAEYKQKIATDYGMLSKQTITTINWKSVIMTTNPNWSISYKYIEDPEDYVKGSAKEYNQVDSRALNAGLVNIWWYTGKTLGGFLNEAWNKEWDTGWQCWKFVNDYLQYIWVTWANNRYYDNDLSTKLNSVNTDIPTVWAVAVFDYNHKSSDWINHGHVAIVTDVDDTGFRVIDSNYNVNKPWKIEKRHIPFWTSSLKWFFDPSQPPSVSKTSWNTWDIFTRNDGTEFDVWNSEIYNSLDNRWKQAVQQLLNNSLARTAITKRNWYSDPEWILTAVSEINPAWSESDYNNRKTAEANRAKLEIGWATSRNATAATTAKRVYDLLDDISDKDLKRTWINTINDLINTTSKEFWNEKIVELQTLLNWLQSEAAGALKWGNAAISDKDKEDMQAVFNANLTNWQLKKAMETMIRLLYDKNESEAKAIYNYWFYKKDPIWTDEVNEWMTNDLWIDLSVYYNYDTKNSTWPDDIRTKYFDWYQKNTQGYSWYDTTLIQTMINWKLW